MAMGYNKNFNNKKSFSTETVHLGTFIHPAEDMLVLKLENQSIPYPNSPVLFKEKQIGKVEEVFGQMNDSYVAVKLDSGNKLENFRLETKFEAYKDKFIQKERFLPREEVEKRKEMQDKKKDSGRKGGFNKSFDKGRGNSFDRKSNGHGRSGDNKKFNDRNGRQGNDRRDNDRRDGNNRKFNDRNGRQGNDRRDNDRSNQKNKKTKFD